MNSSYKKEIGLKMTSFVCFAILTLTACATGFAGESKPEAVSTPAAASGATATVSGADAAYYFDGSDPPKLLALEALDGAGRKITSSDEYLNQDGLTLIMKSTCQAALQSVAGAIEMAGKAATVVYAVSGPTVMVVLGVEDLSKVESRMIDPLEVAGADGVGICCCAVVRCGSSYCCPCPTKRC